MQSVNKKSWKRSSKKGYKRRFMPMLRRVNDQIHRVMMGASANFPVISNTGWLGQNSYGLQLQTNGLGVYYFVGVPAAGAPGTLAQAYSNAAAYASIYEQFRIDQVEVEIMFSNNNSSLNSPLVATPIMYTVVDRDDVAPLANAANALAYSTCKTMQLGNSSGENNGKQFFKYVPTVSIVNGQTGVQGQPTALGTLRQKQWISTDFQETTHLGMKCFIDPVNSGTNQSLGWVTFVFRVYMSFKNQK
jgi:hypothetical protein